jgi:hypothetical protein
MLFLPSVLGSAPNVRHHHVGPAVYGLAISSGVLKDMQLKQAPLGPSIVSPLIRRESSDVLISTRRPYNFNAQPKRGTDAPPGPRPAESQQSNLEHGSTGVTQRRSQARADPGGVLICNCKFSDADSTAIMMGSGSDPLRPTARATGSAADHDAPVAGPPRPPGAQP